MTFYWQGKQRARAETRGGNRDSEVRGQCTKFIGGCRGGRGWLSFVYCPRNPIGPAMNHIRKPEIFYTVLRLMFAKYFKSNVKGNNFPLPHQHHTTEALSIYILPDSI